MTEELMTSLEALDFIDKDLGPEVVIPSGFGHMDRHLNGGFAPGELIVVGGPPKNGKTLYAQTLTQNFYKQGVKSLWLQYEVGFAQFIKKFHPDKFPEFILPKKGLTRYYDVGWAEERIAEARERFGAGIVFIDHIHALFELHKQNASLELGSLVRKLKQVAVDYDMIIFFMCHLRKAGLEAEPTYADYRDSSIIAAETDVSIMVWRKPRLGDRMAVIKICAARRSECMNKKVIVQKQGYYLVEVDEYHDEVYSA
jgi:replicative DNA helicase